MDSITQYAKEAFKPKLGRPLTDNEAAEFAMHLRRFAAFLIDCSKDDALMASLGLRKGEAGSVAPRAVDNTTQNGQEPQERPISIERIPPTAPPRDTSHRESSAFTSQPSHGHEPLPSPGHQSSMAPVTVQKN
jgi:hypothetical protein